MPPNRGAIQRRHSSIPNQSSLFTPFSSSFTHFPLLISSLIFSLALQADSMLDVSWWYVEIRRISQKRNYLLPENLEMISKLLSGLL
jgi:hypothetical protein